MIRRLFTFLSVVSLLLCVLIASLWVLGSQREAGARGVYLSATKFYVQVSTHKHILSFNVVGGQHWPQLQAAHFPSLPSGFGGVRRSEYGAKLGDQPPLPTNSAFSGVSLNEAMWMQSAPAVRVRVVTIAVDHWLILLILAISVVVFRKLAVRKSRVGLCSSCGYDLRASPEQCPECGAAAAQVIGRL